VLMRGDIKKTSFRNKNGQKPLDKSNCKIQVHFTFVSLTECHSIYIFNCDIKLESSHRKFIGVLIIVRTRLTYIRAYAKSKLSVTPCL
jgi:hypothetical protein